MGKFWWIFRHEYTRHVLRRRFIVVLLSVPLYLLFMLAMGVLSVLLVIDRSPVGYFDESGVIRSSSLPFETFDMTSLTFLPFASEEEGRTAVREKRIQALYILPADYRSTRQAKVVYLKAPNAITSRQFQRLLRYNLLQGQPPQVVRRIIMGTILDQRATAETPGMGSGSALAVVVPIAAGVLLLGSIFTTSGYLMQAVVEEKENRTIEILATSASPGMIMSAKVTALIGVGITQLAFYTLPPLALLAWAAPSLPIPIPPVDLRPTLLILATVPATFVMVAGLMAATGAAVTEARESQQVMSLFSMVMMSPFMLILVIMLRPDGIVAQVLSYFPLTASLTLLMRSAFGEVPPGQVLVSGAIVTLAAAGSLWLAGRVFRMGMLRYGRRISLAEIFHNIFTAPIRSIFRRRRKAAAAVGKDFAAGENAAAGERQAGGE